MLNMSVCILIFWEIIIQVFLNHSSCISINLCGLGQWGSQLILRWDTRVPNSHLTEDLNWFSDEILYWFSNEILNWFSWYSHLILRWDSHVRFSCPKFSPDWYQLILFNWDQLRLFCKGGYYSTIILKQHCCSLLCATNFSLFCTRM